MTNGTMPLSPPDRLLTGPGPSNVSASVLEAMQKPQIGHLDRVLEALDSVLARTRALSQV